MTRLGVLLLVATAAWGSGFRAGTARLDITPVVARAVAVEDDRGGRAVIVAVERAGITRQLADEVCARAAKEYDLERAQIVLNSTPQRGSELEIDNRRLADALVTVIGAAVGDLQEARLAYGSVSDRVPVVRVTNGDGATLAAIFGHTGNGGDAAARLEENTPGLVALSLALCGAERDPPGGAELAAEVLGTKVKPVDGAIRAAFQLTELRFRYHTREEFERELDSESPARARRARRMIDAYDARRPVRSVVYPVQAVRFGRGPVLLALGGEVAAGYALRAAREFPDVELIVAGYSNDVTFYVPSRRELRESDAEAEERMIGYGQPGPFEDDVEEAIFTTIRQVMDRVGIRASSRGR